MYVIYWMFENLNESWRKRVFIIVIGEILLFFLIFDTGLPSAWERFPKGLADLYQLAAFQNAGLRLWCTWTSLSPPAASGWAGGARCGGSLLRSLPTQVHSSFKDGYCWSQSFARRFRRISRIHPANFYAPHSVNTFTSRPERFQGVNWSRGCQSVLEVDALCFLPSTNKKINILSHGCGVQIHSVWM